MSFLYIYEKRAKIGVQSNCVVVESEDLKRTLPIEGIESVMVFGDATLSPSCVREFLERDINLTWLSARGKFYGRLESTRKVNIHRQRRQFICGEDAEFCLRLSKRIVDAKLRNQLTVLRRYQRHKPEPSATGQIDNIKKLLDTIERAQGRDELMGYEGLAARYYYQGLDSLLPSTFSFKGRNRQPPLDPFNSLLSFAYTLVLYDVYTAVVNLGLNPYASFLHSLRNGHPALCSDLMEEWRPVLADSLALSVVSKGIIQEDDFQKPDHEGGIYLNGKAAKVYIGEYEKKVRSRANYLPYVDYSVSFRRAIEMQCQRLARAVEEGEADIYQPVVIR